MRIELTMTDLQSGALASWRRALRNLKRKERLELLETSLEDSYVASYITPAH